MISWKKTLLIAMVAGLVTFNIPNPGVNAQEEREGIGISPTTLTLDADPGETLNGEFSVLNGGSTPITYRIYVKDFSILNEEYDKDFESVEGAKSAVEWFTVTSEVNELVPGAPEKLKYSIAVPKDTVPQGYYAVIFAETAIPQVDGTGVARVKRVGSLVYLTVNGGSVEKGELLSFSTGGFWQSNRDITTNLRLQNSGNVHFETKGEARLKDVFGRTISRSIVSGTLLPQTIRKYSLELTAGAPLGLYKVEGETTLPGQTVSFGGQWVLVGSPLWLGLTGLLILAWIVLLVLRVKRRART